MKKLSCKQKCGLILFGVFLCVLILELGLRCSGFVFLKLQERRTKISFSQKREYTILCLGESTTADTWPPYLQTILNENQNGAFTVIDKAQGGINTAVIVANVERYLDEYEPDMVIAMIGINDMWDTVAYLDTPYWYGHI